MKTNGVVADETSLSILVVKYTPWCAFAPLPPPKDDNPPFDAARFAPWHGPRTAVRSSEGHRCVSPCAHHRLVSFALARRCGLPAASELCLRLLRVRVCTVPSITCIAPSCEQGCAYPPGTPLLQMSLIMNESNFQHILRVLNTNLDGKVKAMFALTSIKGVGRRFSNICCKKAEVELGKR